MSELLHVASIYCDNNRDNNYQQLNSILPLYAVVVPNLCEINIPIRLVSILTWCLPAILTVDGNATAIDISGATLNLSAISINHEIFDAGDDALIIIFGCCVSHAFNFLNSLRDADSTSGRLCPLGHNSVRGGYLYMA